MALFLTQSLFVASGIDHLIDLTRALPPRPNPVSRVNGLQPKHRRTIALVPMLLGMLTIIPLSIGRHSLVG
jgi:hypothetical protein